MLAHGEMREGGQEAEGRERQAKAASLGGSVDAAQRDAGGCGLLSAGALVDAATTVPSPRGDSIKVLGGYLYGGFAVLEYWRRCWCVAR